MEIETPRFVLRDFTAADRPAFLAYHADPRSLAFYGPGEADADHAVLLLDTFAAWASERPASTSNSPSSGGPPRMRSSDAPG